MMRINKYIAQSGLCSRRKAEKLIEEGLVQVNGKKVIELSTVVDERKDVVLVDGQKITPADEKVYYMLNKPKGYVTSLSDDRNRKSVMDLISSVDRRIYPVGRLDYESEGLLLLTNDGDMTYKLTHPKYEIPKTYIVKVEGEIKESELAVLRAGVVIDGERYGKCKAKLVKFEKGLSKIEMTIYEGKNREIRKIFDAIGKQVQFLKRTNFAGLRLGGLKRGELRPLKSYEIDYLKSLTKNLIK